jgi:hypothetical protein
MPFSRLPASFSSACQSNITVMNANRDASEVAKSDPDTGREYG